MFGFGSGLYLTQGVYRHVCCKVCWLGWRFLLKETVQHVFSNHTEHSSAVKAALLIVNIIGSTNVMKCL